eukprot:scaffold300630_cov33-Tisochrysis_lutea.AAC.2
MNQPVTTIVNHHPLAKLAPTHGLWVYVCGYGWWTRPLMFLTLTYHKNSLLHIEYGKMTLKGALRGET